MAYETWLFADAPDGWKVRRRPRGGGYQASRDGERWIPIPSVTEITGILHKNLQEWAVRQVVAYLEEELQPGLVLSPEEIARILKGAGEAHRRAARRSAGQGTDLHAWARSFLQDPSLPLPPPPLDGPALRFRRWWEGMGGRVHLQERVLLHPEELYAGRVDLVVEGKEGLLVVDLKTGGRIYPEHHLQVAGYALALRRAGWPITGGLVVALGGEDPVVEGVDLEGAGAAFLGLRRAYRYLGGK